MKFGLECATEFRCAVCRGGLAVADINAKSRVGCPLLYDGAGCGAPRTGTQFGELLDERSRLFRYVKPAAPTLAVRARRCNRRYRPEEIRKEVSRNSLPSGDLKAKTIAREAHGAILC